MSSSPDTTGSKNQNMLRFLPNFDPDKDSLPPFLVCGSSDNPIHFDGRDLTICIMFRSGPPFSHQDAKNTICDFLLSYPAEDARRGLGGSFRGKITVGDLFDAGKNRGGSLLTANDDKSKNGKNSIMFFDSVSQFNRLQRALLASACNKTMNAASIVRDGIFLEKVRSKTHNPPSLSLSVFLKISKLFTKVVSNIELTVVEDANRLLCSWNLEYFNKTENYNAKLETVLELQTLSFESYRKRIFESIVLDANELNTNDTNLDEFARYIDNLKQDKLLLNNSDICLLDEMADVLNYLKIELSNKRGSNLGTIENSDRLKSKIDEITAVLKNKEISL